MTSHCSRRGFIATIGAAAASLALSPGYSQTAPTGIPGKVSTLSESDRAFLIDLEKQMFLFFWEQAHPATSLIRQKSLANGGINSTHSSVAGNGFGLTALCIAHSRGFLPAAQIEARVELLLKTLATEGEHLHGFFFHYLEIATGKRAGNAEAGVGDMALCLGGVLTARQYFASNPRIVQYATTIYQRVDWPWMQDGGNTFRLAFRLEDNSFSKSRWGAYSAVILGTLLGLGSPTHPITTASWDAIKRPSYDYFGLNYIGSPAPLFVHQYPQCWFDLRNKHDHYANYFENSRLATEAHRRWCASLTTRYPYMSDSLWGITASNSANGYKVWGGPPELDALDGTLVPCAPGGSIAFLPAETVSCLRTMKTRYPASIQKYGFVDAFDPKTNWFSPEVLSIDVGATIVMAENALTGLPWKHFMANPETTVALHKAGFVNS